jgi:transposase
LLKVFSPHTTPDVSIWTASTNQPKTWTNTSWKLSPSYPIGITEQVNFEGSTMISTQKIRIYPNQTQKIFFDKCFGTTRYFYNRAVAEINTRYQTRKTELQNHATCVQPGCSFPKEPEKLCCLQHQDKKLPWNLKISLASIRSQVLVNNRDLTPDIEWQREIPYDTRQLAIKQAVNAYSSCVASVQRGNIQHFELKFAKKHQTTPLFHINDGSCKIVDHKIRLFPTYLKENPWIRISERTKKLLKVHKQRDCKIMKISGKYYLILTVETPRTNEPKKYDQIALDPGVRTFQTGYSDEGVVLEFGHFHAENIKYLHARIDQLQQRRATSISRTTKYHLKQLHQKLHDKVKNVVKNLHYETATILVKNFKTIFLPTFQTHSMLTSETLTSTTKRSLQGLSHYQFQQRLIHTAFKHRSKVFLVDESFTTKTCGQCGKLKEVGGDKIYTCSDCHYTCSRDVHAARNILLKTLTEQRVTTSNP